MPQTGNLQTYLPQQTMNKKLISTISRKAAESGCK